MLLISYIIKSLFKSCQTDFLVFQRLKKKSCKFYFFLPTYKKRQKNAGQPKVDSTIFSISCKINLCRLLRLILFFLRNQFFDESSKWVLKDFLFLEKTTENPALKKALKKFYFLALFVFQNSFFEFYLIAFSNLEFLNLENELNKKRKKKSTKQNLYKHKPTKTNLLNNKIIYTVLSFKLQSLQS